MSLLFFVKRCLPIYYRNPDICCEPTGKWNLWHLTDYHKWYWSIFMCSHAWWTSRGCHEIWINTHILYRYFYGKKDNSQGRNGKKTVESCTLWYYFEIWHGVRVCDGDHKNHWLQVGKSLWWPVATKFKMAATDIIIVHISGLNNHTLKCNTSFYMFSGLVSPFLMSI